MDSEPQTISEGDRIAQVMIVKPEEVNFIRVPKLIPYGRATDGFGSSGK
jgi:dUTPase